MFLIQLMGRVGRDSMRSGKCFFDLFTTDDSYLKIEDVTKLSGQQLCSILIESYQKYIQDETNIAKMISHQLSFDIVLNSRGEADRCQKQPLDIMQDYIKKEFKYINIQYSFSQEKSIRIFEDILKRTKAKLKPVLDEMRQSDYTIFSLEGCPVQRSQIMEEPLKKLVTAIDNSIGYLNSKTICTVHYSDDMSLEDFAHYISSIQPVDLSDISNQDPNSDAPIFILQKNISQEQQANLSPHSQPTFRYTVCTIISPFIAVGFYAAIVGNLFNYKVGLSIFCGTAAMVTIACFALTKKTQSINVSSTMSNLSTIASEHTANKFKKLARI